MGAAAEKRWEEREPAPAASSRARLRPLRPGKLGVEGPPSRWNVLAEELVSYPPRHQKIWLEAGLEPAPSARSYADAWLERELESLARRRLRALAASRPRELEPLAGSLQAAPLLLAEPACRPTPTRRAGRLSPPGRPRPGVAGRPGAKRGLRRLLPGVATLAVLAAVWFGAGALSASARPRTVVRLPGSVPVANGYAYIAKPGDTLWSIASRVEPGSDPRPLVDRLEQEIGGGVLQPGERLILPR